METTKLNNEYWTKAAPEEIIGDNAEPKQELLQYLNKGAKILDIGCGNGKLAENLADSGYYLTAVDINPEVIHRGIVRSTKVEYLTGDVTIGLPFPDETFDAAVISFVLVNLTPVTEREKAIREIYRLLKPGGYLWINEGSTSEEYQKRYDLSFPHTLEERSFFVFKDKNLSRQIQDPEQLRTAIDSNLIARVAHHFTVDEVIQLFSGWEKCHVEESFTQSPNTGMKINMVTFIFKKPSL